MENVQPGDIVVVRTSTPAGSSLILPVVVTILLLAFFFWLAYATGVGIFESQSIQRTAGWFCSPGQCAVDNSTGEKICPTNPSARQPYDIMTQHCSDKYNCTSNTYRYAILSDGSTDAFGQCDDGVPCRCSSRPRCARYITSIFQTVSGNPYTSSSAQFNQIEADIGKSTIDGPAISSNAISSSFCEIPSTWLFRSVPGCGAVPPGLTTFSSLKSCFASNPCLYGTPAYVTDDIDSFTSESLTRIPVACVNGSPNECINDPLDPTTFNVPVYDTNYGGIVCVRVSDV